MIQLKPTLVDYVIVHELAQIHEPHQHALTIPAE
jgi:predicted metal-dependent hydrolase